MRIPLSGNDKDTATTGVAARNRALEKDIQAAKRGDWEARHRVERSLMPLLKNLAKKRSDNTGTFNQLIDCGKAGIANALRKVPANTPGDRFQIFALPYIEEAMDKSQKKSIWKRLFGS